MQNYLDKPLPSSTDAEKTILGAILLDNALMAQAISLLKPEDFYSPLHRRIFDAMKILFDNNSKIDPILVGEELKKKGQLENIGGIPTITQLAYGLPHFSDIQPYISVLLEKTYLRLVITLCNQAYSDALSEDVPFSEIVSNLEHGLQTTSVSTKGFINQSEQMKPLIKLMQERAMSENRIVGLPTGLTDLDMVTGGLGNKDLILIAARPSMGKTSIALNIMRNITEKDNESVIAFFSLEMDAEIALPMRIASQEAKIDMSRMRNGFLTREEWVRLAEAVTKIQGRHLEVDDDRLTFPQIKARAMRLKAKKGRLDLIVIDHLNLVLRPGRKDDRVEIGDITKQCKDLAKLLDVPIILLHQLSRKPEDRKDKRPIMSDLGESGFIEQDADLVLLLFRGEYYFKDDEKLKGVAEVIIGKNRNGPTQTVKLSYIDFCSSFENYTP